MGIKLRRKKGKMAILSALVFSMVGSFCMNNISHAEDIEITSPVTDADGEVTWDKVQFGSYYQTAKFSPEPIRWRILSIDESTDTAYVMANNVLEAKAYDEGQAYVTWENCSLRNWLNNEFYNTAFNDSERAAILLSDVEPDPNPENNNDPGNATEDYIYIPSYSDYDRDDYHIKIGNYSYATDYAYKSGCGRQYQGNLAAEYNSIYWYRTPGQENSRYGYQLAKGYGTNGAMINDATIGVRPVMKINLKSEDVIFAGDINSQGESTGTMEDYHNPYTKKITHDTGEYTEVIYSSVYIGKYNQTASFEKEPLDWRVLSVDGNVATLLSEKVIEGSNPTNDWADSDVRKLLNETFYNAAFTDEQKAAIKETTLSDIGSNIKDKVYLLSVDEACKAEYGFNVDKAASDTRNIAITDYSYLKCLYGGWLLRTPGSTNYGTYSTSAGKISEEGMYYYRVAAIRPVIRVDLSKTAVKYAGTVTAYQGNKMHYENTGATTVALDADHFPDDALRNYISKNYDNDSDGILSEEELANADYINVDYSNVSNMDGIEYLYNLSILYCDENNITDLDVSKNLNLKILSCASNKLTSLDVSNNKLLQKLYCYMNEGLTSLDVSNNTVLTDLSCSYCGIDSIDLSKNKKLNKLIIGSNDYVDKKIDISKTPKLNYLRVEGRNIDKDALNSLANMEHLELNGCNLDTIDLSNLTNLEYLDIRNIKLNDLDLQANINLNTLIVNNCDLETLNICNNKNITDLYIENNKLSELEIKNNPVIKRINVGYNQLTSLDVSNDIKLETLNIEHNQIEDLNIEGSTAITQINCDNNKLKKLDLSELKNLKSLYSENNNISELKLNCINSLEFLDVDNNELTELDLRNYYSLWGLECIENKINSIKLNGCDELRYLYCYSNELEALNVSECTKLNRLHCYDNKFSEVDVSALNMDSLEYGDGSTLKKYGIKLDKENKKLLFGAELIGVSGVTLDGDTLQISVGESITLHYTIEPENADNKKVIWTVKGSGIITVDKGVVTGINPGTATVTVRTDDGDKTATCLVTVIPNASPSPTPTGAEEQPKITPTESPELEPTQNPEPAQNPEPVVTQIPDQGSAQNPDPAQVPVQNPDQGVAQNQLPTPAPAAPATGDTGKTLAVGAVVADTSNTAKYVVVGAAADGTGKVAFAESVSKDVKSLTIPDTVNLDGTEYKVTEIRPKALKNRKKLKSVTIGKNVEKIGGNAFQGCGKLKKINIKTTLLTKKSVGAKAFSKIGKNPTVKVPKSKKKEYKKWIFKKGLPKKAKIK